MIDNTYVVTVQLAVPADSEGCAVLLIGAHGMPERVADGLGIVTAVKLASQVRASLDGGHSVADIRRDLDLENAGIPA
jgi:hypothetical protein